MFQRLPQLPLVRDPEDAAEVRRQPARGHRRQVLAAGARQGLPLPPGPVPQLHVSTRSGLSPRARGANFFAAGIYGRRGESAELLLLSNYRTCAASRLI